MDLLDLIRQFSGRRYFNLESYDKHGEPKLSPVLSLGYQETLYVCTGAGKWKIKRIRRNPEYV